MKKNKMFLPNAHVEREQCTDECEGCNKIYEDDVVGRVCIAYIIPKAIHRFGCVLKSNRETEHEEKKKINPIKASKRG